MNDHRAIAPSPNKNARAGLVCPGSKMPHRKYPFFKQSALATSPSLFSGSGLDLVSQLSDLFAEILKIFVLWSILFHDSVCVAYRFWDTTAALDFFTAWRNGPMVVQTFARRQTFDDAAALLLVHHHNVRL